MLAALRRLEALLVRVESALAVVLVVTMLLLASYNVFYRNVLVALQTHYAHSGPPVEVAGPTAPAPAVAAGKAGPAAAPKPSAEGFAGDWGEGGDEDDEDGDDEDAEAETPANAETKPAAEGFAGDWGEGGDDEDDDDAKKGSEAGTRADDDEEDDDLGDDDDQFENLPDIDAVAKTEDDGKPRGGPPPPGSFGAQVIALVDALKVEWIDLFLRQLVILVAFFGAMLATVRSKHINVDVFSKLLRGPARRFLAVAIDVFAALVCVVFADAGRKLVVVSREYEKELLPWADEWTFQLMYPFGFALLALHFAIRAVEDASVGPKAGGA